MENYSNPCLQLEALSLDEMLEFGGGGLAYDLGHLVGDIARAVFIGACSAAIITLII